MKDVREVGEHLLVVGCFKMGQSELHKWLLNYEPRSSLGFFVWPRFALNSNYLFCQLLLALYRKILNILLHSVLAHVPSYLYSTYLIFHVNVLWFTWFIVVMSVYVLDVCWCILHNIMII